jgi:LAO/AO transport system kinase
MGFDRVLIETVGVGQDEIDIVQTAQTSVVILVPGLGDDIQAIKAGILEIADIFVVNKADRDGAHRTVTDLKHLQQLAPAADVWEPPVLKTIATLGEGVESLVETIDQHAAHLRSGEGLNQRRRSREAYLLRNAIRDEVHQRIEALLEADGLGDTLVDQLLERKMDPYTAAERVLKKLRGA